MPKRPRQGANDLKTELVPETNCRFVRRKDKVELHRAETKPERFAQAMLSHSATNSSSARIQRDHKRRVRDMRTGRTLIRSQNVSADDFLALFCGVGVRVSPKPIRQRIFARHLRIECVGVARRHDLVEDIPDRVAIFFYRWANVHRRTNVQRTRDRAGYFRR